MVISFLAVTAQSKPHQLIGVGVYEGSRGECDPKFIRPLRRLSVKLGESIRLPQFSPKFSRSTSHGRGVIFRPVISVSCLRPHGRAGRLDQDARVCSARWTDSSTGPVRRRSGRGGVSTGFGIDGLVEMIRAAGCQDDEQAMP